MIYLRIIDNDIFEWLLSYKNEVYSGYNVITPEKGKKKLTNQQKIQAASLTLQGALATLDMKLGVKPTKEEKEMVKAFEQSKKEKEEAERLVN